MCGSYEASVTCLEYALELPSPEFPRVPPTLSCPQRRWHCLLAYHRIHTKAYTYPYVCVCVCVCVCMQLSVSIYGSGTPFCQSSTGSCGCLVLMGYLWCTQRVHEGYSLRTRGVRSRAGCSYAHFDPKSRADHRHTQRCCLCPSRCRPHACACHCISFDGSAWKGCHGYAHNTPIAGVADRHIHALDSFRPRVPPEYPLSSR